MFSIITPLHNNASTLLDTFNSLKNQYYENWEWIIIDDYSEDGSLACVRDLKRSDKRISIYQNRGRNGACACRNIGIEKSKGSYLIFLDPDDMLRENSLSERMKLLKKNNALQMLISKTAFFISNNPDNVIRIVGAIKSTYEEMISAFISHDILWTGTSVSWKKDFLENIGGWNVEYPRLQDVELNIRALLQKPVIIDCDLVDLLYRCDNFPHQKMVKAITGFNLLLRDYYFQLCNDEIEDNTMTLYQEAFNKLTIIIIHYINATNHSTINSDKKYFIETLLTICDDIKDVKLIAKMINFDFDKNIK